MSETFKGIVSVEKSGNTDVTARIDGENGNLRLGGSGTDGDVFLQDGSGRVRVRIMGDAQRIEMLNPSGDIIGMHGGGANIRAGTNGQNGDLFLYDNGASNIFSNSEWRIRMSASNGSLSIRGTGGDQICSLGPEGNLRLGGHGTDGDVLLFPSGASNIFRSSEATIHMDAQSGDITLRNADCAEEFEIEGDAAVAPGTLMAIGDGGRLRPTAAACDRAVVGVIAGAGDCRPGIVLGRVADSVALRQPVALLGKAWVNVVDLGGPIAVGDLLTSSDMPGVAMRAADPMAASGALIGKAMAPLAQGAGQVPMVIALH